MKIVRHCSERLPGGERLWRLLAKKAGFDGTLLVYGYGVGYNPPAESQRIFGIGKGKATIGDYLGIENRIRVWVDSSPCRKFDFKDRTKKFNVDLFTFAHELGHHVQHLRGLPTNERGCDNYATALLRGNTVGTRNQNTGG